MISIIIPYYNAKRYFEETLNSVYKQTGVDFELIVVNDGSSEEDEKYLEQINKQYGFTLIHQINRGVSAARNAGLAIAQGTHVLFLDADDVLLPNALFGLTEFNTDVVIGTYSILGESKAKKPTLTDKQFVMGNPIQIGTALIKKECFKKLDGFNTELAYGEDMDFWFHVWLNQLNITTIDTNMVQYRVHGNSAMQQQQPKKLYDNAKSLRFRIETTRGNLGKKPWLKEAFLSRSKTNHWYAREMGIKGIIWHYRHLFNFDVLLAFTLLIKMIGDDYKYLKVKRTD